MNCPKCKTALSAKVINDPFDGELNLQGCVCGYSLPIHQSKPFDIMKFRSLVSQLMVAA